MMEHPRADFLRENYEILDGIWDFDFDDNDVGIKEQWYKEKLFSRKIVVPYVYQSENSGINSMDFHPILWYSRNFNFSSNKRCHIVFGAVDYESDLYINGHHLMNHKGGYLPFSCDITDYLVKENNKVTLRVVDKNHPDELRGKQYWEGQGDRCWYSPSSGIWQSVYLEERPNIFIKNVFLTPDIDKGEVKLDIELNDQSTELVSYMIKNKEKVSFGSFSMNKIKTSSITVRLTESDYVDETDYWSPDNPVLFSVDISISSGDKIRTYFGMRKINIDENGIILLNNKPLYQRLVLDQGYFSKGLLTGTKEEFINDIRIIKSMGFNGVRMHQKIENPMFYYLCDLYGLLVWGELPSGYSYTENEKDQIYNDIRSFILRDYNHPSIITWVPLNESWGVRKIVNNKDVQSFANSLYFMIKALDNSRLISTNDGWEQVLTDICGVHDYTSTGSELFQRWQNIKDRLISSSCGRMIYASGYSYNKEPVLITEFGGIALEKDKVGDAWGYKESAKDKNELINRIDSLVKALLNINGIQGYCYTQFTDVFQEVNGLVDINRNEKVEANLLSKIFANDIYSNL